MSENATACCVDTGDPAPIVTRETFDIDEAMEHLYSAHTLGLEFTLTGRRKVCTSMDTEIEGMVYTFRLYGPDGAGG